MNEMRNWSETFCRTPAHRSCCLAQCLAQQAPASDMMQVKNHSCNLVISGSSPNVIKTKGYIDRERGVEKINMVRGAEWGVQKMHVVHMAPVQLTFSDLPLGKTMF